MARKGCKCSDGSYSTRCCTSTKRSVRTNSSSSNKTAQTTMGMSLSDYATRRKQQAFIHVLTTPEGRKAIAYGGMQAEKAYEKRLSKKATRRVSLGLVVAGRAGSKFVPIVGQVSLAYDTYQLSRYVINKRKQRRANR